MRGKGTKLGEGCPKVRLSQDRMTILSFHLDYYEGKGTKLGEGEGTKLGEGIRDFYVRDFYHFWGFRIFTFGIISFGKSSWRPLSLQQKCVTHVLSVIHSECHN